MSNASIPLSALFLPNDPLLDDRISSTLDALRKKTFYLGDTDVHKKLTWCNTPQGNIVLEIPKLIERNEGDPPPAPVEPRHAILSAIVLLTYDDFHLSEDDYWETPTPSAPTLADVVLTCTGGMPKQDTLCTSFIDVIENIDILISKTHKQRHLINNIRPMSTIDLSTKVLFRHVLFTVRLFTTRFAFLIVYHPPFRLSRERKPIQIHWSTMTRLNHCKEVCFLHNPPLTIFTDRTCSGFRSADGAMAHDKLKSNVCHPSCSVLALCESVKSFRHREARHSPSILPIPSSRCTSCNHFYLNAHRHSTKSAL